MGSANRPVCRGRWRSDVDTWLFQRRSCRKVILRGHFKMRNQFFLGRNRLVLSVKTWALHANAILKEEKIFPPLAIRLSPKLVEDQNLKSEIKQCNFIRVQSFHNVRKCLVWILSMWLKVSLCMTQPSPGMPGGPLYGRAGENRNAASLVLILFLPQGAELLATPPAATDGPSAFYAFMM